MRILGPDFGIRIRYNVKLTNDRFKGCHKTKFIPRIKLSPSTAHLPVILKFRQFPKKSVFPVALYRIVFGWGQRHRALKWPTQGRVIVKSPCRYVLKKSISDVSFHLCCNNIVELIFCSQKRGVLQSFLYRLFNSF